MQKGILNGVRSLNWEFWENFPKNPIGYSQIALLTVIVFIYDLFYEILTPACIKKIREERWREIERQERFEEEWEARGKGPDSE